VTYRSDVVAAIGMRLVVAAIGTRLVVAAIGTRRAAGLVAWPTVTAARKRHTPK
jgi:hypothetical protein